MPVHFVFLFVDFIIYEIEIAAMLVDFFMIWLNFYNYMTLNKITCGIECGIYIITVLFGLTHFKRVLLEQPYWLPLIFYVIQFLMIYPVAFFFSTKRLILHFLQQVELKTMKKNQNIITRMDEKAKVQGRKALEPIIIARANSLLGDPSDQESEDDKF